MLACVSARNEPVLQLGFIVSGPLEFTPKPRVVILTSRLVCWSLLNCGALTIPCCVLTRVGEFSAGAPGALTDVLLLLLWSSWSSCVNRTRRVMIDDHGHRRGDERGGVGEKLIMCRERMKTSTLA